MLDAVKAATQKTKSPADNLSRGDLDSFELNDLHWSEEMTVTEVTAVTKVVEHSAKHSAVHFYFRHTFLLPAGTSDGDASSTQTSRKEPFQTGCHKYASDQFYNTTNRSTQLFKHQPINQFTQRGTYSVAQYHRQTENFRSST